MAQNQGLINEKRDWSDLPSDIVNLIAKKLPNLVDFIRVHVTCKSWRSSTPISEFPLCIPWLLELHQESDDHISVPATRLHLYSLSSNETLTIPIKKCWWFRGSSNSYLPCIDDITGTISLFNPLTNDELFLPPIQNLEEKPLSFFMVRTEPGPIRDHRVLIIDHGDYFIDRWAIYDPKLQVWSEQEGLCHPFWYCRGMFFCSYLSIKTDVYDVSSAELLYEIPPHEDDIANSQLLSEEQLRYVWLFRKWYIVESGGEILRVHWYYPKLKITTESRFQIYRLNFDELGTQAKPCWVKVSDIGDQNLFLEVINCFPVKTSGFSMTTTTALGLRGGHIYFIDPYNGKPYVHDIAVGTTRTVPCPFENCTWFVMSLC